jgi:hypothetical protein
MAAMRWKNVSLPIAQGVDTKSDSKALQPGKLANLENGVFTKAGSVIKRNGYDKLSDEIKNATVTATHPRSPTPTAVRGLHTKDRELLLADDERLFSYISTTDEWKDRGRFKSMHISTETIVDRNDKQILGDCATLDGITVYAWESGTNVFMSIIGEDTGAVYYRPAIISASASRPKVVAVGTAIHVYFYTAGGSGTLHRVVVSPADVASLGVAATITAVVVSDLHASVCRYDVCADETNVYIAYYTNHGSRKLKILRQTSGGSPVKDHDFIEAPSSAISICREPNTGALSVTWANPTDGVKQMFIGDTALQATLLSVVADTDSGGSDVLNIASSFRRDRQVRVKSYALDLENTAPSEQWAELPNGTTTDPLALINSITIEAWIKFETLPTGGASMCFVARDTNTATNNGYYFRFTEGSPSQLQFAFRDGAGNLEVGVTETWAPVVDTWYHVAVSHDRALARAIITVNGSSLGTTTGLDTTVGQESSADFRIGSHNAATPHFFDGMISEVRIWDTARTVDEINTNKYAEFTGINNNLVGYWRLNNDYEDSSGNGLLLEAKSLAYPPAVFVDGVTAGFDVNSIYSFAETEQIDTDYPVVVFWEFNAGADYNHEVWRSQISVMGTFYPASRFRRHSGIASRAWTDQNDVQVNLVHASLLQTTYFTYLDDGITANGALIAKMEPGVARGIVTESHLPNVQDLGNSLYQWVGGFRKRLDTLTGSAAGTTAAVGALYEAPGLKRFRMDYASPQAHDMVKVGKTGYLNGGMLWQYDGNQVVDAGFNVYPENFTAAALTGGLLTYEDVYNYKVYACWINANGEKERSATATSIEYTVPASASSNRKVRLTIQTIAHTNKHSRQGLGTNIHFEIYRTVDTPPPNAPFYKVSGDDPSVTTGDNCFLYNNFSADTVTFDDAILDTALVAGEVDYQNSGELDNIPPPAPLIIGEGKDRIFTAGFEDTSEIRYSKQHFAGEPVNFHDTLRITVPEDGGAITGIRTMNNNLVVFKEESIYVIPGDGPNNLGFGQFGAAQLVTNDVGSVSQRSLVDVPSGIMFQSKKGIYTLTKQYKTTYTGAPVEGYNASTVTDGVLAADKNHVLFVTDGRALMFDYLFNQWSTFTNHEGTAATFWNGSMCYGRTDARVYRENAATRRDAGSRVVLRLETAWVKLNTLQGFQRIRRAMVLGEFVSDHRLALDIAYDYELLKRRLVFDAAANISTSTFGDPLIDTDGIAAEFGDGDPFGSGTAADGMASRVYQFRAHLPIQKCQSVKFYFEDMHSIGGYLEEGYEITELMLEVGIKRGTFKTADTRSI